MRTNSYVAFDHSDGPYKLLLLTVELLPETPEEHASLKPMKGIEWEGERAFLRYGYASNEQGTETTDGLGGASPEPSVIEEQGRFDNESPAAQ